jgi:hypothetical protein
MYFDQYMKEMKWRLKFKDLRNALLLFVGFMYSGHNVLRTGIKFSHFHSSPENDETIHRLQCKPQNRQLYVVTEYVQSPDTDNKLH